MADPFGRKELIMPRPLPTRTLAERPDLDQLKRQAKELLAGWHARQPSAVAEVERHYRNADPAMFALHDAQLVIARAYGFESWPKLKAYVEGRRSASWSPPSKDATRPRCGVCSTAVLSSPACRSTTWAPYISRSWQTHQGSYAC
jgi:hypothetical protein